MYYKKLLQYSLLQNSNVIYVHIQHVYKMFLLKIISLCWLKRWVRLKKKSIHTRNGLLRGQSRRKTDGTHLLQAKGAFLQSCSRKRLIIFFTYNLANWPTMLAPLWQWFVYQLLLNLITNNQVRIPNIIGLRPLNIKG